MNTVFRIKHAAKRARTSVRWHVYHSDDGLDTVCSNNSPRWRQAWVWGKARRVLDWTPWIGKARRAGIARDLRSCPYCGETSDLVFRRVRGGVAVVCYECGARGPVDEWQDWAADAWNARPAMEAETERLYSLLTEALRVLREASYPWNSGEACPVCGKPEWEAQHRPNCDLQSMIDALAAEVWNDRE